MWNFLNDIFLAHLYKRTLSCCHPDSGVGGGLGITLISFMTKLFYVMGKVLIGKLFYMWTGLVAIFQCFLSYKFIIHCCGCFIALFILGSLSSTKTLTYCILVDSSPVI